MHDVQGGEQRRHGLTLTYLLQGGTRRGCNHRIPQECRSQEIDVKMYHQMQTLFFVLNVRRGGEG